MKHQKDRIKYSSAYAKLPESVKEGVREQIKKNRENQIKKNEK